jgi:hypothetical protein
VAVPLKILLATCESLRSEFEPFLVPDGIAAERFGSRACGVAH